MDDLTIDSLIPRAISAMIASNARYEFIMLDHLSITFPKQRNSNKGRFEKFYRYYAGYPESFAREIITSSRLNSESVIYDPWNGSGTTTRVAVTQGHISIGHDINPVMAVVALARLVSLFELPSFVPLAREIVHQAPECITFSDDEPLSQWFDEPTRAYLRGVERTAARLLMPATVDMSDIQKSMSCIAANIYLALFSTVKSLLKKFFSSNPTWIKKAASADDLIHVSETEFNEAFIAKIESLCAAHLADGHPATTVNGFHLGVMDSTRQSFSEAVDLVLTSPPYCTRIDYASATSVELAILSQIFPVNVSYLSKSMVGTPKITEIDRTYSFQSAELNGLLDRIKEHPSKASSTYYFKTHYDYYYRMSKSIDNISSALKSQGVAVLVVQDSYYKEIRNDVSKILCELGESAGLVKARQVDFNISKTIASINPKVRNDTARSTTESVICFVKG